MKKIYVILMFALLVPLNYISTANTAHAVSYAPPLISALDGNLKNIPNGGSTNSNTVVFRFGTIDYASSDTTCSLDDSSFLSCKDTTNFNNISLGNHTFQVKATSPDGKTMIGKFSWTVSTETSQNSPVKIEQQAPHTTVGHSSSVNVGVIGGTTLTQGFCFDSLSNANDIENGGCIPLNDTAFKAFHFTPIAVPFTSSSFSGLDTIVLNVVSPQINCNLAGLTSSEKTAIVNFMTNGGKLIIYDSECSPQDYTWLPSNLRFVTNNPGPNGAVGTAIVKENNTLSTNALGDQYEVNLGAPNPDGNFNGQCPNTDACGDANVLTARGSDLCVDILDSNTNQVTGPVHVYSKDGKAGTGILIYAGWDMDFSNAADVPAVDYPGVFAKLFYQELQQQWNPSGLTCGTSALGVTRFFESAQIPVTNPQYLDVNNVTHKVYVSNGTVSDNFGNVTVIDGNPWHSSTVNTILKVIKDIAAGPQGVAADFINNLVYTSTKKLSLTSEVINSVTDQVCFKDTSAGFATAIGAGVDPLQDLGYVAINGNNRVNLYSGCSGPPDVSVPAVNNGPFGITANPANHLLYVTNGTFPGTVTTINEDFGIAEVNRGVKGVTTVGNEPHGIAINPNTHKIYVANSFDSTVTVLSSSTIPPTVLTTISVGNQPEGVAVNPRTNIVYVTDYSDNLVSIIDGSTDAVIQAVPVGTHPLGVTVDSVTNRAYVANSGSNSVSVIMESCIAPSSGTWTIQDSCVIAGHVTPPGKIIVTNNAQVTIQNGAWLEDKLELNNIIIKPGSSILIKSGGKLS